MVILSFLELEFAVVLKIKAFAVIAAHVGNVCASKPFGTSQHLVPRAFPLHCMCPAGGQIYEFPSGPKSYWMGP